MREKLRKLLDMKRNKLKELDRNGMSYSILLEEINDILYILEDNLSDYSINSVLRYTTSGSLFDILNEYRMSKI